MRADARLFTAIAIIAICGVPIVRGWGIVHFSAEMAHVNKSSEKEMESLLSWSAVPAVASMALRANLNYKIDPSDQKAANQRRQILTKIVSMQPLSSLDWLYLSGMQLVTAQPLTRVLESLEMSIITGPNEGAIMPLRAIFAISEWEVLTPDLKRHVPVDLGPIISPRTPAEGAWGGKLRAVLATKSERTKTELREALAAAGVSAKDVDRLMGS
jgi:hypothetical protein